MVRIPEFRVAPVSASTAGSHSRGASRSWCWGADRLSGCMSVRRAGGVGITVAVSSSASGIHDMASPSAYTA